MLKSSLKVAAWSLLLLVAGGAVSAQTFVAQPATLSGRSARIVVRGAQVPENVTPRLRIEGVTLQGIEPERRGDELVYWLDRDKVTDAAWERLHGSSSGGSRNLDVSLTGTSYRGTLAVSDGWVFWWFLGIAAGGAVLIVILARLTSVMRDSAPAGAPPASSRPTRGKTTFSLARFQFAWWTTVMVVAVVFLFVTRSRITVSGSGALLLGLSAGTVAGSRHIAGAGRKQKLLELKEERDEVQKEKKELGRKRSNSANERRAELDKILAHNRVVTTAQTRAEPSRGFLRDTMSASDGAQWHRLQNMTWSLAVGTMFLIEVYQSLAMPTLPPALLGLTGVSAAGYVGMKIGEPAKHQPRAPANRTSGPRPPREKKP